MHIVISTRVPGRWVRSVPTETHPPASVSDPDPPGSSPDMAPMVPDSEASKFSKLLFVSLLSGVVFHRPRLIEPLSGISKEKN